MRRGGWHLLLREFFLFCFRPSIILEQEYNGYTNVYHCHLHIYFLFGLVLDLSAVSIFLSPPPLLSFIHFVSVAYVLVT